MDDKPKYEHDCEFCVFLGNTIGGGKLVDCYFHEGRVDVSLVARYGSEGPEYYSTRIDIGSPIPMGHAELYACLGFYCAYKNIPMPKITFDEAHGYFSGKQVHFRVGS